MEIIQSMKDSIHPFRSENAFLKRHPDADTFAATYMSIATEALHDIARHNYESGKEAVIHSSYGGYPESPLRVVTGFLPPDTCVEFYEENLKNRRRMYISPESGLKYILHHDEFLTFRPDTHELHWLAKRIKDDEIGYRRVNLTEHAEKILRKIWETRGFREAFRQDLAEKNRTSTNTFVYFFKGYGKKFMKDYYNELDDAFACVRKEFCRLKDTHTVV